MHNTIRRILIVLHVVIGVAALAGGLALLVRPDGSLLHLDVALLHDVFADYTYPAAALLGIGALQWTAVWLLITERPLDTVVSASAGATVILWLATQFVLIGPMLAQQVASGVVGFMIFALAMELIHEGEGPHWLPTEEKCARRDW